ncbi:STAS domain-containing protein [Gandjariella thermophila]|uniref:Anti-sigma factor antagonist n=1 Tax=Gandjariella thermophila TaxID=1931992 RepID=A0A4D4IZ92_9PSEU|nr:STAS domain-containing protein [Gandjariella thermophila]GDY28424.1 anti-sigma-B factor antagonist [Gandjariella thermophila]
MPGLTPSDAWVQCRQEGNAVVATVGGEIDLAAVPVLQAEIEPHVKNGRPVVIDLRGVPFLDSAGLSGLVRLAELARDAGGSLRVVANRRSVVRVFRLTGVAESVGLSASLEEALSSSN